MSVSTAIILAAGMGMRLRSVHAGRPKGLLRIDGIALLARSLDLLSRAGVGRVVLVTGYEADQYRRMAADWPDVQLVHNDRYATTGSMASLDLAFEIVDEDTLVLESDLFYEFRALAVLLANTASDVVLVSGPTSAGDEVWVQAPDGVLQGMSKDRTSLSSALGEFVGICRFSRSLNQGMRRAFRAFREIYGHGNMCYETGALVQVCTERPVRVHLESTLLWGEIDDASHLRRVRDDIAPRVAQLKRAETSP